MADKKMKKAPLGSLQPDPDIFDWNDLPADDVFEKASGQEKESFIQDRKSVSYWADAWRRLRHNVVAMVAAVVLILIMLFAFVGPMLVPYGYAQTIRGAENLHPWHTSLQDQLRVEEEIQRRKDALQAAEEEALTAAALPSWEEFKDQYVAEQLAAEAAKQGGKLTRQRENILKAQMANEAGKAYAALKEQAAADKDAVTISTDEETVKKELGIGNRPFGYSRAELERKAAGEKVFPHVFGTDYLGRDRMVRVMIGARVSLIVGVCSALLVLIIGAVYGAISGYAGGVVDTVMQRIVELIYSIPEVLVILLISATLKPFLDDYQNAGKLFSGLVTMLGPNLISMFIAFALLYWVTMSRIVRGQILQLKNQEYVTAARALGAGGGRVIKRHLLPNCIGQIVTTTFLQIPSAIFLESFLSFLGVGVSAPLTSLGSMCSEALAGMYTYPYRLLFPAVILSVMILSLNLFGDGLRDALDPRLKK